MYDVNNVICVFCNRDIDIPFFKYLESLQVP